MTLSTNCSAIRALLESIDRYRSVRQDVARLQVAPDARYPTLAQATRNLHEATVDLNDRLEHLLPRLGFDRILTKTQVVRILLSQPCPKEEDLEMLRAQLQAALPDNNGASPKLR